MKTNNEDTEDINENMAVQGRRIQEGQKNILDSGVLKMQAEWHKAVYDSYINCGFDKDQAMELLFYMMDRA